MHAKSRHAMNPPKERGKDDIMGSESWHGLRMPNECPARCRATPCSSAGRACLTRQSQGGGGGGSGLFDSSQAARAVATLKQVRGMQGQGVGNSGNGGSTRREGRDDRARSHTDGSMEKRESHHRDGGTRQGHPAGRSFSPKP